MTRLCAALGLLLVPTVALADPLVCGGGALDPVSGALALGMGVAAAWGYKSRG